MQIVSSPSADFLDCKGISREQRIGIELQISYGSSYHSTYSCKSILNQHFFSGKEEFAIIQLRRVLILIKDMFKIWKFCQPPAQSSCHSRGKVTSKSIRALLRFPRGYLINCTVYIDFFHHASRKVITGMLAPNIPSQYCKLNKCTKRHDGKQLLMST